MKFSSNDRVTHSMAFLEKVTWPSKDWPLFGRTATVTGYFNDHTVILKWDDVCRGGSLVPESHLATTKEMTSFKIGDRVAYAWSFLSTFAIGMDQYELWNRAGVITDKSEDDYATVEWEDISQQTKRVRMEHLAHVGPNTRFGDIEGQPMTKDKKKNSPLTRHHQNKKKETEKITETTAATTESGNGEKKKRKPKGPARPTKRVLLDEGGILALAHKRLRPVEEKLSRWIVPEDDADPNKELIGDIKEAVGAAWLQLEELVTLVGKLPDDFKPKVIQKRRENYEPGDKVQLKEDKRGLYEGMYNELDVVFTVKAIRDGGKVFCEAKDTNEKGLFPPSLLQAVEESAEGEGAGTEA